MFGKGTGRVLLLLSGGQFRSDLIFCSSKKGYSYLLFEEPTGHDSTRESCFPGVVAELKMQQLEECHRESGTWHREGERLRATLRTGKASIG